MLSISKHTSRTAVRFPTKLTTAIAQTYHAMNKMSLKRPGSENGTLSPPPLKRKIAATTTNKAVADFFKPASAKEPEKTSFSTVKGSLFVSRYEKAHTVSRANPVKVAAFDLDGTLITTKSGLKFARGEDDWKWWDPTVPTRLKELHSQGYAIVVISNQAGVSLREDSKTPKAGVKSVNNLKGKLMAVFKALDLPMSAYAATEHDIYRKPRTGMWEQLCKDYRLQIGDIDLEGSLFVGDAAGRAEDKAAGVKRDHACSDRDFAANVGIKFHTPEEFFLNQPPRPFTRIFNPSTYLEAEITPQTETTPIVFTKKNALDLVLFCGSPGAGKSTFYWQHLQPMGYERVNQDILKSRERCMKVATQFIEAGTSVAVDNTNADYETRADWISLAKKLQVPARLVHFTASAGLSEHNNAVRAWGGELMNPEKRQMLPNMAFTGFSSRYREPRKEEGFQDVTKIDFKFEGTEEQKAVWSKFWIS